MSGLEAAHIKLAALRAAGAGGRMSRAGAVRAYWRDHFGLNWPQGSDVHAMRADYKAKIASLKGTSLKAHVRETCFECVGGYDDPGPQSRVHRCPCTDCPLHPVRPYQGMVGQRNRRPAGGIVFEEGQKHQNPLSEALTASGGTQAAPEPQNAILGPSAVTQPTPAAAARA